MTRNEILFGLMVAIFLAVVVSPFVSPLPDGLEKVAQDKGFLKEEKVEPVFASPIPDYAWPGLESKKLATSAAGIAGTLLVFGIGYALAVLIRRGQS